MQYWSEMNTKYGFNDGESVPAGIERYREVYLRIVNALLEKHKSKVRVIAFDRGGCHNWCLILRVSVETYNLIAEKPETIYNSEGEYRNTAAEPESDEAYDDAIVEAYSLDIDDLLEVDIIINKHAVQERLNIIRNFKTDCPIISI